MPSNHTAQASTVSSNTREVREKIEAQFYLSDRDLEKIEEKLIQDFRLGCRSNKQGLPMIPTFVTSVPNGTETGTFLAVDFGGTNLRVHKVVLNGDRTVNVDSGMYVISPELKTGTGTALFDYIANCVKEFLDKHSANTDSETSFPVKQTALDKGELIRWTKGFSASGVVGQDVVGLLQDALDRQVVPAKCNALLNDGVGTLLSHAYHKGDCVLGAIFATGTNGAFVEKVKNLTKMHTAQSQIRSEHMVVNTEWGAFDVRAVLTHTPFDGMEDPASGNWGPGTFGKLISGKYLGEITRKILLELIGRNMLFSGNSTPQLNKYDGLETIWMAKIESDVTADLSEIRETLIDIFGVNEEWITRPDLEIVRWACQCVSTRAAKLSGVAIAATIKHTHVGSHISVGIDGSVFESYPKFKDRIRESLRTLLIPEVNAQVKIEVAKDGSSIGAALCAYQAKQSAQS